MPATDDSGSTTATPAVERHCVACGYNLYGLGDEPRCPECGLLNVPEGYRRQVWELVDSGKWFFSGFFSPLKKRLPGWWWSLDRPGDVKRAIRRSVILVSGSVLIGLCFTTIATCFAVEIKSSFWMKVRDIPEKPGFGLFVLQEGRHIAGLVDYDSWTKDSSEVEAPSNGGFATLPRPAAIPPTLVFRLPRTGLWEFVFPTSFLPVMLWLVPAFVGVLTQIRKTLPSFARAPRTIVAAALYESHRVPFATLLLIGLIAIWAFLDTWGLMMARGAWYSGFLGMSPLLVVPFGAAGWIGPLRSDYTRQLIQSRWQIARIVLLYGTLFALLFAGIVGTVLGAFAQFIRHML